jgi:hypothetical protein
VFQNTSEHEHINYVFQILSPLRWGGGGIASLLHRVVAGDAVLMGYSTERTNNRKFSLTPGPAGAGTHPQVNTKFGVSSNKRRFLAGRKIIGTDFLEFFS